MTIDIYYMISNFLQISESETTADKFTISCQRYCDAIPFFRFNSQLIERLPSERLTTEKIELILQTKQTWVVKLLLVNIF